MSNSLYGQSIYGSAIYGNVANSVKFRYSCALSVENSTYWRYASLAATFNSRYFRYNCYGSLFNSRYFRYKASGLTFRKKKIRYACKTPVAQQHNFRYKNFIGVAMEHRFRYSNVRTMALRKFRYSAVVPLTVERRFRYLPITDEFVTIIGGNPSGNPISGGGGTTGFPYVNPLQGLLYATETALPESHDLGLASFAVVFKESQPAQWMLSIMDPTGKYNPDNTTSAWHNVMDDDAYTNGLLTKFIRSGLTYGGVAFEFVGVPTQFSYSREFNSRFFSFTWAGVDRSESLFRSAKAYDTKKSRLGEIVTAHQIIRLVLADNGFSCIIDMPDFPVPVMHMQDNKPIEFVKSLMEVMGAEWLQEGDNTIHIYLPTQKSSNHNWEFDLGSNSNLVYNHSVDSQFPDIYNQVTISRTREVGISTPQGEDGEGNEMTVEDFGVYTIEFDTPLNGLYYRVLEQYRGNFNTLVMRDAGGAIVGVLDDVGGVYAPSQRQSTGYNVKSVEFNWDANFEVLATGGFGRIRFFGTTNDSFSGSSTATIAVSQFDTAFTVIGRYSASYSKHGPKPIELPPNPLIPTEAVAQIYATEYLRKVFRSHKTVKYKVPLNFLIRPGDTISEVDASLSLNRKVYVVEAAHNFSNEPGDRFSMITCVEYPTDFSVIFVDEPDDPTP